MATVQTMMLRLAGRVDPRTKKGQVINDANSALTVTGATNASPIVITTSTSHGLLTGNQVYIASVGGNTNANNSLSNLNWTITYISATTFSLDGSSGNASYTSGGTATPALVGSVGGAFTPQRLLDIYNDARYALFSSLKSVMSRAQLTKAIRGNVVQVTNLQFSSGSASQPTGYVDPISLADTNGYNIPIIPVTQVNIMKGLQSSTNRFVYEKGTTFFNDDTTTYVANASTYVLKYYGITTFTLTNVLGGSTTEEFVPEYEQLILELAEHIANGVGHQEVATLAKKLVSA